MIDQIAIKAGYSKQTIYNYFESKDDLFIAVVSRAYIQLFQIMEQTLKDTGKRRKRMKNIAVIGCGAYMDSGYGCPGEWRCLKAAALGEGEFSSPSNVVSFIKCECPGRTLVPNFGMAVKLSEIKPDAIHLSSCLANSIPGCTIQHQRIWRNYSRKKQALR